MRVSNKLICSSMLLLAVSLPVRAQSLRDYIRSRAESTDSILLKAITPSLSIVRQQFRLEKGGEFFGKNNNPFYGETYSLCVKVSGASILQNQVATPWKYDSDYQRVNQSGKYNPVLFWSFQRSLADSVFIPTEWDLEKPISSNALLYESEDKIRDFGLDEDKTSGYKSGYMVWAYSSTNTLDSAMHVLLKSSTYKIDVSSSEADVTMSPDEPEKVIGGIFVVPIFEKGARIQIKLVGVAAKSDEGKWLLHLLANQPDEERQVDKDASKGKKEGKMRQRTKGSSSDEPTPVG